MKKLYVLLATMFLLAVLGCATGNLTPPLSSDKAITAYSLNGVAGAINETGKTIAVTMPYGTDVTNLTATFSTTGQSVSVGYTAQVSGTTANDFSSSVAYTVTAVNGSTATYTVIVAVAASSAKAITAYSLAGVPGVINETAKTIAVTLPYGTDVTSLIASFTITGQSLSVGTTTQESGTTANDFTSAVTYTANAADSSTVDYTVTVTVALSAAKAITAYSLDGVGGTINEAAKTIAVTMPYGTDVTKLTAIFITTGTSISVGSTAQVSGATANDFSSAVTYTVTAANSSTVDYTVTVTVALSAAKAITGYYLAGVTGTINEGAKTIAVAMPYGTDVTTLVAAFATTGQGLSVGATTQISGFTANNFTSPVVYTVTAANSTTVDYTVTVTVAKSVIKLPRTGQTVSYDTGAVDDGGLQKGVAWPGPRFTDNGDQTVTDNLTGLMWTKDGITPTAGFCSGGVQSWQAAFDYVSCLNTGNYLGHNDWRLPNRTELHSLFNYSEINTSVWLNNSGFSNVQANWYWSSTSDAIFPTLMAWSLNMSNMGTGNVSNMTYMPETLSNYVWPVRTGLAGVISLSRTGQMTSYDTGAIDDGGLQKGAAWPSPRFTVGTGAEADCVTDNLTGLMWAKNGYPSATPFLWQDALNYIATTTNGSGGLCGHTDWRMPNIDELQSLIHAGNASTAAWLNTQGFSNVQGYYYWSSTTYAVNSIRAWAPYMVDGVAIAGKKSSATACTWPVRGGQ